MSTTSDHIASELRVMAGHPGGALHVPEVDTGASTTTRRREFCATRTLAHGGFGGGTEFPAVTLAERLTAWSGPAQRRRWPLPRTGTAMAIGGMYDQLAVGFSATASTTLGWYRFREILYDNALLLRAYAALGPRRTGDQLARRYAGETARFLLERLREADMFASSAGRRCDGRRGLRPTLDARALTEVLEITTGPWAASVFGVT